MELQSAHAKLKDSHTSVAVMMKSIAEVLARARSESVERAMGKVRDMLEKGMRFIEGVDNTQMQSISNSNRDVVTNFGEVASKSTTIPTTTEFNAQQQQQTALVQTLQK